MGITLGAKRFQEEAKRLAGIAKEEVTVEFVDGALYVFGSEIATLRILREYRLSKKARQAFSNNLGKFYFCLETDLDGNHGPTTAQP